MAKRLYNVRAYSDTAAKWATNTRVYPPNSLLIETDTGAIKRGDGVNTYADLGLIGAGAGTDTSWDDIADKPATFEPSAHDHAVADISDWPASFPPAAHDHAVVSDATSGLAAAATIQDLAEALSARILALETPAG